jgi:structural maintenance of chromosome 4
VFRPQRNFQYDLADSELKICRSHEESERNKLEKLQEAIKNTEATIKQRTEEVAQLKRKIPLTENSLRGAHEELEGVKREEAQITKEIRQKRMHLEEVRSSMQMSRSRGKILDSLMQQKREGKCRGLYGRLGDLGAIDQKYDVAISTACGRLDNIVVDTVSTAQWCIEFLKKHGLGRATFIALDKQEHLREVANSRIRTPENVHRLFDLVQIQDETVRTAFYFSLRDTLVANDLDQASRIAYGAQRYRVVTLKGDLIETSGTMSGGGKTVSRGRMGQSVVTSTVDPKEIENMESVLEKFEDRFKQLMQEQAALENQIATLQPELNHMKVNLEKFTQELQSLKGQQPLQSHELRKQENVVKSTKSDPKQIQKLTATVEAKKAEFEEASANAQELQVDVDKLTAEIKEKTTGKMRTVDKNLSETTKSIDKCKAEVTRLRVAITTSERNAKKCEQKIATLEQNIVDAENRLREAKAERDTIEEDGQKLLKCIEELTEQLSNEEGKYAELKQEVTALTGEEKKLLLKKVDVDQTFKTINEKLNECKATIHQWHAKLTQLTLHEIPEEQEELKKFEPEELQSKNTEVVELELQAAQNSIKNTKPNLNAIQEYKTGQNVYMAKAQELDAITSKRNDMKSLFDKVKNQRRDEFMVGYNIIKLKLKEMYQMITLGGDADFEILDSCDPFADGVQLK